MFASGARPLNIGALLLESVLLYGKRSGMFAAILVFGAVLVAAVWLMLYSTLLGFSTTGSTLDPKSFFLNLSRTEWTLVAASVLASSVAIAFSTAASIHVAAGASGFRSAFASITSKSMQIFWLQCVIYALAARFSPWAALLLWLGVAFAMPVALCEDLGPSDATDRAWTLSAGNRLRLLLLEIGLLALPLVVMAAIAWLFLLPGSPLALATIPPVARAAISWILIAFVLAPVQFIAVVLTRAYKMLAAPQPALHAKAASNVTS